MDQLTITAKEVQEAAAEHGVILTDDEMSFEFAEIWDRIHHMYEAMEDSK